MGLQNNALRQHNNPLGRHTNPLDCIINRLGQQTTNCCIINPLGLHYQPTGAALLTHWGCIINPLGLHGGILNLLGLHD